MKLKKYNKGGVNGKPKKPNLRKTDTFLDYKTAASQFSDYNPSSDTVFVGTSLDPGAAERQTQRSANVSSAKGASDSNYNAIPKMYKTKNEKGQTVYVSLSKHEKYSEGGTMKLKKYGKGGKYDMYQNGGGVTVTKKMVDDEFKKNFESSANLTNDLARQLAKGVDSKGMPLKPAAKKALAEQVEKRKAQEQKMKANYRYVGTKVPGGKSPSFKEGGKMYLKGGQVKLDKNEEDFKIMKAKKKYNKGGSVGRSYDKGNPTPTGRTLTPDEVRITGTSENQGYSNPYAKVNKPVTAKDILEKTEMSRLTEALRKSKYSTANLSLGDMRKIAKTKGVYDSARELAREDYQRWLAKNRK